MQIWIGLLAALTICSCPTLAEEVAATPIEQASGVYPDELQDREGVVTVQFAIDAEGRVKNAKIVEATPATIFDEAALAAVATWRYSPRKVDGHPVEQSDNRVRLRFKPQSAPTPKLVFPAKPDYPQEAYDAKIEGSVKLRFDVDEYGLTQNIEVISSLPDASFDKAAISAMRDVLFSPVIVAGKPIATRGLTTIIPFKLQDAHIFPKVIKRPPKPEYPRRAADEGVSGYCRVRSTINIDGTVQKAEIEEVVGKKYFYEPCYQFAMKFIYEPERELSKEKSLRITEWLFRFNYNDDPEFKWKEKSKPIWVKLEYTIHISGETGDIKVLEKSTNVTNSFVNSAIDQLEQTKFQPHTENGSAVEWPGQKILVRGLSD